MNRPAVTARRALLPAAALAGVAVIAACSSSSGTGSAASGAASSTPPPGGGAGGTGAFARGIAPAASGEIAAITGRTLQVQSTTQQTAVAYTSSTRITEQKSTTLSAIKVGSCISASAATPASGSSGSASAAPVSPPTSITATRVQLLPASGSGNCTGAAGPGGGAFPRAAGSGFPTGARTRSRGATGGGGLHRGLADRVTGKVTAVSGSTLTVQALAFPRAGSSPAAAASPSTALRTVHVTAATTYTTTAAVPSSALKVGLCAVVAGSADSAGTVTARSILLSPKTGATCTTGFGGRLGRGSGTGAGSGGQGGN